MDEKKYELLIVFGTAGYVYYKTDKASAKEALDEFLMKVNGLCDASNLPFEDYVTEATLRDEDFEDVDSVVF